MDEEEGTVWAEELLTAALTEGSVAVGEGEPEPEDISSDSSLSVVVTDEVGARRWGLTYHVRTWLRPRPAFGWWRLSLGA